MAVNKRWRATIPIILPCQTTSWGIHEEMRFHKSTDYIHFFLFFACRWI
jgi:hypothetical protein